MAVDWKGALALGLVLMSLTLLQVRAQDASTVPPDDGDDVGDGGRPDVDAAADEDEPPVILEITDGVCEPGDEMYKVISYPNEEQCKGRYTVVVW